MRDADLKDFFQRENQLSPPSTSDNGQLRLATKSDLHPCLEDLLPQTDETKSLVPEVDMIVLDGAAIVKMLKPVRPDSFAEYVNEFMAYIRSQFVKPVQRVDLVFDEYRDESRKAATRMIHAVVQTILPVGILKTVHSPLTQVISRLPITIKMFPMISSISVPSLVLSS